MDGHRLSHVLIGLFLGCAFSELVLGAVTSDKIVFYESFDKDFSGRWVVSESEEYSGPWKHAKADDTEDYGLLVTEKAKRYAIATSLPEAVDPKEDTVVLQYDVRLQNGLDCGGAYLKFLMPQEAGWTPNQFKEKSPYSVMFGPDKCGSTNKVHFIFRHKSPKTGEYVEHHLKNPPTPGYGKTTHVYTAVIYPNNTLHILIDGEEKKSANLLSDDFEPPVLPPKTIPDPEDKKPEDWDERRKISDPAATKPDEWDEDAPREIVDVDAVKPEGWLDDEPLEVDDPKAEKPDDWDEEEDGEWEPPRVDNPKCSEAPGCGEWKPPMKRNPAYKGKWTAPLIDNPAFKGVWKPREIDNPNYFELERPNLEAVAAVGIEIWTMSDGIIFDNILVTHDVEAAKEYRKTTWDPKRKLEEAVEEEKKKKEEAEKKEPEEPKASIKSKIFDNLYKIADTPFLKGYKEQIHDFISKLEESVVAQYIAVAILGFSLFLSIYLLLPGQKPKPAQQVTVEQAKKEDISSPDDAPVEGTEENAATSTEELEFKKEDEEVEEKEELIEEKEEEQSGGEKVRRRARRDS